MAISGIRARSALVAGLLLTAVAGEARAQGFLDKLSRAAVALRVATIEASLNRVATTDLEPRALPTLALGGVTFGVGGVEAIDSVGVRLHVYLYNAGAQDVTLPLPPPEGFVLVDGRGRRVAAVGGARWKGLPKGATTLTVPALERIGGTLVFGPPGPDAGTGALKVGGAGVIAGVPLSGAATGSSTLAAGTVYGPTPAYPQATPSGPAPAYPQVTPSAPAPAYPQATPSGPAPAYPQGPGLQPAYPQGPGLQPAYAQVAPTPVASGATGVWTATTTRGPLQLELRADGSYDLGGATGSYELSGSRVVFRGGPAAGWGDGTAALAGDQLTFTWQNPDGTPGQLMLARAR